MDAQLNQRRAETAAHGRLKRLALIWAQAQGYSACAVEVGLPGCRYRADLVACRPDPHAATAIFECKQALPDFRRDNCCSAETRERLETVYRRRLTLEKHLRVHYPNLRITDSLFPEFESHDFARIEHRTYAHVLREMSALQNRLSGCTKFENLVRYRSANLFLLVLPAELFREEEIPIGWGALVEKDDSLSVARKPVWHEVNQDNRLRLLQRIAAAGTRLVNRQHKITFDDIRAGRTRFCR